MILWDKLRKSGAGAYRALHDSDDSECIFWEGDIRGVNLHAVCPVCNADND